MENESDTTELEIRLSDDDPLGDKLYFFEMSVETFLTERRTILPAELLFLNDVDDTLTLSTTVVQSAPNRHTSTISIDGDWLDKYMSDQTTQRIPFIVNDIHIQIRDA